MQVPRAFVAWAVIEFVNIRRRLFGSARYDKSRLFNDLAAPQFNNGAFPAS